METSLLQLKELKTYFFTSEGIIKAVDGVSWQVNEGETLGVVGESGCGKSVMALSILRLISDPPGRIVGGEILFQGQDLLQLSEAEMRHIRGHKISMIFQEPMSSLNPVFTIGNQIAEAIRLHQGLKKKEALDRAVEMLRLVGIPSPEKRVREYPHQLSGGMLQRAMIAMALSCHPNVLIADEPTTALDVTTQAQILELMQKMKEEFTAALILITHDLGIMAELAQRVVVMYAGKVMEQAEVEAIFEHPLHPYTRGLLASLPRPGETVQSKQKLRTIPGQVSDLSEISLSAEKDRPAGCKFSSRCEYRMDLCQIEEPPLREVEPGHLSRCWLISF